MVSLPQVMPRQDAAHVQLAPYLLRVNVRTHIFSRYSRRTHVQGAAVGQDVRNLVRQREAQVINAEVAVQVLQGKYCNSTDSGARRGGAMLEPPRSDGRQYRDQQAGQTEQQISLPRAGSLECIAGHAQR